MNDKNLRNLDGKRLGNYRLSISGTKELPLAGWLGFSLKICNLRGKCVSLIKGIYSSGGKGVKPWLDLDYIPFDIAPENLEIKLFGYLGALIPPGGHIMVSYEDDCKIHAETRRALAIGAPACLTPLGFLIFSAGFQSVKDWYLAEGGKEGPRKLWGEKAPTAIWAKKFMKETKRQISHFLKRKARPVYAELEKRTRKRARELLKVFK